MHHFKFDDGGEQVSDMISLYCIALLSNVYIYNDGSSDPAKTSALHLEENMYSCTM